uniref:protein-ribulosamine 3-kinase n=1 Tax=Sus scrofa TaxID=9823 RepID=A0A8D1RUH2_PIG
MDTVVEMNGFRGQVGAPPRCCPAPGTCRGAACAGGTGLWSRRCAGEQLCPSVRPSWAEWSVAAWERAALSARRLGFARSFRPWRRVCSLGAAASACGAGGGATAQSPAPLLPSPSLFRQARRMFEGELASLTAILKTGTVRVPKPIKVLDAPGGGSLLVMEHLDMRSLGSHAATLGVQLADLHLDNKRLGETLQKEAGTVGKGGGQVERPFVDQFGFDVVTCCGYLPQVNEWQDDWPTFFARHRLQAQLDLIEKDYADREARELWSRLQVKIPDLFCGLEIVPALLHGDLWSGNVAEDDLGPVVYDPASFYGHSEFELAIALMFGGFPRPFFTAYHRKVPKAPGFDRRLLLYQLFNYLNHWNHFGRQYRSPSLGTMRKLLK